MSQFKSAQKTIPVQFSAIASGDGHWGMPKGFRVDFNEVVARVSLCEGEVWAELQFKHEHMADHETGLAYTDKGITDAVQEYVVRHGQLRDLYSRATGSEQGMQGVNYLSCDADVKNGTTLEALIELGYTEEV